MFLAADHHLYHTNITTFTREDGTPLRPFADLDEMHTAIEERHNAVVGARDKVYFLGDVFLSNKERAGDLLRRLKGRKRLVMGNHDSYVGVEWYLQYFDKVFAARPMRSHNVVLTHIPLHPSCLNRWGANIHGHLHDTVIDDPRYYCVSMEAIDYTPVHLDEVHAVLKARGVV